MTTRSRLLGIGREAKKKLKGTRISNLSELRFALSQYRTSKKKASKAAKLLRNPRTPKKYRPSLAITVGNRRKPVLLGVYWAD